MGINFCGFLSMVIYEVLYLYTWCLRYTICSAWFLDIRISTCYSNDQSLLCYFKFTVFKIVFVCKLFYGKAQCTFVIHK